MANMLAVDIGGTKTLFQLSNEQGEILLQLSLESQSYESFDACLAHFLEHDAVRGVPIDVACFAVAGPVQGQQGRVTKLPWVLDAQLLAAKFQIGQVILCNDFEAVGHGIACVSDEDLETLHTGHVADDKANRAVIGAGTGLGQAILIADGNDWRVLPTEGGHVDFAPANRTQELLLEHLQERFGHVSYDRLVCGSGLVIIYNFLRDYKQINENPQLRLAMINNDPAAAISEFALQQNDPLANAALEMFFSIYGAQAGNLALAVMARGGIYLAGGIAAKNMDKLKQGSFIQAFVNKGRMQELVESVPVHVVLDPEVGLKGARLLAQKALYN